ncbi:MAG: DUF559 domain-containing protein [Deltaproteobacteria bacterium]|nr:DUF559 domain-containing protein [Deltaproteobacteria bacterium]
MESKGYKLIRSWNNDVWQNIARILKVIYYALI